MTQISPHFSSSFPLKELKVGAYTVFYEECEEALSVYFSKTQKEKFLNLLHEAQIRPKKMYQEALQWKTSHPKTPPLDNLLAFLHLQNHQKEKAEALIKSSYEEYPSYFFAKINYADQCLRQKKVDQIPLIFPSFDLHTLFPLKKKFHVSEFRCFMILLSRYHLFIKNRPLAQYYYKQALAADPSHPSVFILEKEVFKHKIFYKSLLLFRNFLKL